MKPIYRLAGLAVLALIMASCREPAETNELRIRAEIIRIIDGDTFEARLGPSGDIERLRLIGIDSPEKHPSRKLNRIVEETGHRKEVIMALGQQATDHATLLTLHHPVVLALDPANTATRHRDPYDRLLVYVYVLGEAGAVVYCVNERMIADGYAHALTRYPFDRTRQAHYRQLERLAREEQRGLWSSDAM